MTRSRGWLRAAVLSLLVLSSVRASADIPPPPDSPETKRVPVTIELDWGVFADRVSRRHVVASGDTLRSLAAKYLGDKARWKAIVDANPALAADPDHILAGATLWIPPTRSLEAAPTPVKPPAPPAPPGPPAPIPPDPTPPAPPPVAAPTAPGTGSTDLSLWYDAFWQSSTRRGPPRIDARATPGELPEAFRAGGTLLLVPHAVAAPFVAALAASRRDEQPPSMETALFARLAVDSLVHKDDPTVRIVTKARLAGVANRVVEVEAERVRYDASNAVVTRVWDVPPPDRKYDRPPGAPGAPPPPPTPAPDAPPADAPPAPTFAPPSAAVPPPPPSMADPVAPAMAESAPATPPAPAPATPPAKDGGSGDAKPPISPLVLVVASLVALALIGVVVLLRRGAGTPVAATPAPSSPSPPPAPTSPPSPAGSKEFPPGSPPPVA